MGGGKGIPNGVYTHNDVSYNQNVQKLEGYLPQYLLFTGRGTTKVRGNRALRRDVGHHEVSEHTYLAEKEEKRRQLPVKSTKVTKRQRMSRRHLKERV